MPAAAGAPSTDYNTRTAEQAALTVAAAGTTQLGARKSAGVRGCNHAAAAEDEGVSWAWLLLLLGSLAPRLTDCSRPQQASLLAALRPHGLKRSRLPRAAAACGRRPPALQGESAHGRALAGRSWRLPGSERTAARDYISTVHARVYLSAGQTDL